MSTTGQILLWVWGGGAVTIFVVALAIFGWAVATDKPKWARDAFDYGEPLPGLLMLTMWPGIVVLLVLTTPFWIGGLSGLAVERRRQRRQAKRDERRELLILTRDMFDKDSPAWVQLDEQIKDGA